MATKPPTSFSHDQDLFAMSTKLIFHLGDEPPNSKSQWATEQLTKLNKCDIAATRNVRSQIVDGPWFIKSRYKIYHNIITHMLHVWYI